MQRHRASGRSLPAWPYAKKLADERACASVSGCSLELTWARKRSAGSDLASERSCTEVRCASSGKATLQDHWSRCSASTCSTCKVDTVSVREVHYLWQ